MLELKDTCKFILINFYNWQLFIKNSFGVEINSKDLYLFFKLNKNAKKKASICCRRETTYNLRYMKLLFLCKKSQFILL